MDEKIKIFVSCHKKSYLPSCDLFYPIQVGTVLAKERFERMLHDDEGDNISDKNRTYCELTAQYWAWKNEDADYYGFFHYRRYFSFSSEAYPVDDQQNIIVEMLDREYEKKFGLNEKRMREIITKEDVIVSKAYDVRNMGCDNVYQQYITADSQYKKDIDLMLTVISELYPEYSACANKYMNSVKSYICNMFIMKKQEFHRYCKWIFDILFEVERRADFSQYSDYAYRVMGFLGERLLGIYITYLKNRSETRIQELQRVFLCQTEPDFKDKPADNGEIVVALVTGKEYVFYTAALVRSIVVNSNSDRKYKIVCFSRNISEKEKNYIIKNTKEKHNFSICFVDTERCLFYYRNIDEEKMVSECSLRLLVQDFLKDYEKVIYIDSDCIVKEDLSELYDVDISQYWYGACKDIDVIGSYNQGENIYRTSTYKKYLDKVLKIKKPYEFYQPGILLINLVKIREELSAKKVISCLKKLQESNHRVRDALNYLAAGKILELELRWNTIVNEDAYNRDIYRKDALFCLPRTLMAEYNKAKKSPAIIHFAGNIKPWNSEECECAVEFWKVVKEMDEYEIVLFKALEEYKKKGGYSGQAKNNFELVAEPSIATKFARTFLPEKTVQKMYKIKCKIMH